MRYTRLAGIRLPVVVFIAVFISAMTLHGGCSITPYKDSHKDSHRDSHRDTERYCFTASPSNNYSVTPDYDFKTESIHRGSDMVSLTEDEWWSELKSARVIIIGETHDDWSHHLAQLEIICRVSRLGQRFAVGLEQFQRPSQQYLDTYTGGETTVEEMLTGTDYFNSWGYDFRLYEPIVRFVRESSAQLVALNASSESIEQVREHGLTSEDGSVAIDELPTPYVHRLRAIFNKHLGSPSTLNDDEIDTRFRRFVNVQQTWERTMSSTASGWLATNPDSRLIILAGAGHVAWPDTIPDQIRDNGYQDVISIAFTKEAGQNVDYLLDVSADPLPASGRLGLRLDVSEQGIFVEDFSAQSAGQSGGIKKGDQLVSINGRVVAAYAEVRQLLWRTRPGDDVEVKVVRDGRNVTVRFKLR